MIVRCLVYLIATMLVTVQFVLAEDRAGLTLDDSYKLALQVSENLKRSDEDIKSAEAKYREALGTLYPNVHGIVTQRFRDSSGGSSSDGGNFGNDSGGSFQGQGKHPFQTSLSVKQPIFSGFRDIFLVKAQEAEVRAVGFDRARRAELLYQDVADFYNQVAYYESDLKILEKAEKVLDERIVDLKRFIQLGKSKDSEIQAAQSDLADVGATKARVTGLLDASKEMLGFLINQPANTIFLKPEPARAPAVPLEQLVEQAKTRADIKAALARVTSAGRERKAAERERWPRINFEGNYYPYQEPDSDRDWDMFIKMDVPLYEGGSIDARIAQSESKERSSILTSQEGARVAEREVRTAFSNVESAKSQVERLKSLLDAARKSYEAQKRDYELGVVTNLDVLAAIRVTLDAARRLIEAESTLQVNVAKLKVAAGGV